MKGLFRLSAQLSRWTLAGCGPDGESHAVPGGTPRRALGQMQHEPTHQLFHQDRLLQQAFTQDGDLNRGAGRALGLAAQLLEQHIRRGVQQHPELIGTEPLKRCCHKELVSTFSHLRTQRVGMARRAESGPAREEPG